MQIRKSIFIQNNIYSRCKTEQKIEFSREWNRAFDSKSIGNWIVQRFVFSVCSFDRKKKIIA